MYTTFSGTNVSQNSLLFTCTVYYEMRFTIYMYYLLITGVINGVSKNTVLTELRKLYLPEHVLTVKLYTGNYGHVIGLCYSAAISGSKYFM